MKSCNFWSSNDLFSSVFCHQDCHYDAIWHSWWTKTELYFSLLSNVAIPLQMYNPCLPLSSDLLLLNFKMLLFLTIPGTSLKLDISGSPTSSAKSPIYPSDPCDIRLEDTTEKSSPGKLLFYGVISYIYCYTLGRADPRPMGIRAILWGLRL